MRIPGRIMRCVVVGPGMALLLWSCTGAIGDAGSGADRRRGGGGNGNDPPAPPGDVDPDVPKPTATDKPPEACGSGKTRGAGNESVRRLTREELRATLSDLLPIGTRANAEIDAIGDLDATDTVRWFVPNHVESQAEQWFTVADKVGDLIETDATLRGAVSDDACLGVAPVTDACWKKALPGFLRRALRRPATEAEVAKFATPLAGKDAAAGMHELMLRVLMAPDFVFHIEEGGIEADDARVRLTQYEIASRISYGVLGSLPDPALAQAADNGELATLEQIRAHVKRLMETPAAREKVTNFFLAWMDIRATAKPDPVLYERWAKLPGDVTEADPALRADVVDFIKAVVLNEGATLTTLMTKKASYTKNDMLQALYGASGPVTQGEAYETPEHAGLALRAAFLVSPTINTHPILRGVRFLRGILCEDLPTPEPSVIAMRDDVPADPLTMPNFELTNIRTGAESCMTCHSKINPVGFVLENYDPLGRVRTEQPYLEPAGADVRTRATHPLPGAQDIKMKSLTGTIANGVELAEAVAKSPATSDCMGTNLIQQNLHRVTTTHDACAVWEIGKTLRDGRPLLDAFVQSVANEDIFWRGI